MARTVRSSELRGRTVERKRDGAIGIVGDVVLSVSPFSRPGIYGTTIVTVVFADPAVVAAAGGPSTGDLSWFRSNFRVKE